MQGSEVVITQITGVRSGYCTEYRTQQYITQKVQHSTIRNTDLGVYNAQISGVCKAECRCHEWVSAESAGVRKGYHTGNRGQECIMQKMREPGLVTAQSTGVRSGNPTQYKSHGYITHSGQGSEIINA